MLILKCICLTFDFILSNVWNQSQLQSFLAYVTSNFFFLHNVFSYKVFTFNLWIYSSRKQIVCFSEVSLLHKSCLMLVTVPCHRLVIWGTRYVDEVLLVVSQEKVGKSWAQTGLTFCDGSAATGGFDWSVAIEGPWEQYQCTCSPQDVPWPGSQQAFWAAVAKFSVGGILRAGDSPGKGCSGGWGAGRQTEFTLWILSGIIFSHLEMWNNITAESFI